ncbi:MAG: flagellar biosynthesis protein FlhB [Bacteroidetes bacterium]|nr:flagellar biosynthesis protein FlhB [Bacteroidota bacterium]
MSDQPEKHEKEFAPSAQKIRKAREDGNVFRSQEITSVVSLALAMGILSFTGMTGLGVMRRMFEHTFIMAPTTEVTRHSVVAIVIRNTSSIFLMTAPFLLLMMIAGVAMSIAQSGWNLTPKPLMPKAERISPLKGMKRLFSARGLFSAGKSFAKIIIVGPIAYVFIRDRIPEFLTLQNMAPDAIVSTAIGWAVSLALRILAVLFVVSGIDFAFERWKYQSDLKMTFKEVRDEAKETEGDPHMRNRRKALARELIRPRLDHAVMKSDVVITNPTHYAVALRYDPSESDAPRVMAKGMRKRALRIKALAFEYGIPVIENKPLARALYSATDELEEIPEELYQAIAAILAEIYRNRNSRVA